VAVLVLSVITIGIAVTASSGAAGTAALVLVLAGTVMLLGGLLFAARSITISANAIDYEVQRTLSLGSSILHRPGDRTRRSQCFVWVSQRMVVSPRSAIRSVLASGEGAGGRSISTIRRPAGRRPRTVPLCAAVIEQTMDRPRPACSAARLVAWGSIPLGALAGGFLSTASGAQTVLLILTGIMGAVAGAATLVRGMRQLPPPSRPGKHPGNQLTDSDRDACPATDLNSP
jgi:hypothetical protein